MRASKGLIPDKCNPTTICDMGTSELFAAPFPGRNINKVLPFGWTEYEAEYRPLYVPFPRAKGPKHRKRPEEAHIIKTRPNAPKPNLCQLCNMAECQHNIPAPWDYGKEKVVVHTGGNVRTLYVKQELKNEHPILLSQEDYCRIVKSAMPRDKKVIEEECLEKARQQEVRLNMAKEKAEEMRAMDHCRLNATLSPEALKDQEELLLRSEIIVKDDLPAVRTIESVILRAKVQAIRDMQIKEKEIIRQEIKEENDRLNELVEQLSRENSGALVREDQADADIEEEKKRLYKAALQEQFSEQEARKYLMKKSKELEAQEMRKIWDIWEMEDIEKRAALEEKKHNLAKELLQEQLEVSERKKQNRELEKKFDKQLAEMQAKKIREQEQLEKDQAVAKKRKEIQQRKIGERQKRAEDSKSLRDELRAKRYLEQQEKEWRRKELGNAEKRKTDKKNLKEALLQQIEDRKDFVVTMAALEKAQNDKAWSVQKDNMDDHKREETEREIRNAQYRLDLCKQINNFKIKKIEERKQDFIEGINLQRKLLREDTETRACLEAKIEELESTKLPHRYLHYIRKAVAETIKPEWQKKFS